MTNSIRILAVLAAFHVAVGPAAAQQAVDPEKRAAIMTLMEITGAANLGKQLGGAMVAQMLQAEKRRKSDISDREVAIIHREFLAAIDGHMAALVEMLVPIYARRFTTAELGEIIAFYRTPTGQKVIVTMPAIVHESMAAGRAWGENLLPSVNQRINRRLREEGLR